ncbi:imidazole glycerol phosphate synthase subunit HisH [soil metagenome]
MIVIVNSGGANIASIVFALERMNVKAELSHNTEIIRQASHVILPGVGAAAAAMQRLKQHDLIATLQSLTQPVLGICLGMQLLFSHSNEGDVACLDIIPGTIELFNAKVDLTIPHMGWNTLQIDNKASPLVKNIEDNSYVYFVHSYIAPLSSATVASTDYGQKFSAIVEKDNFFGTQFHPERSGVVGAKILENFLKL